MILYLSKTSDKLNTKLLNTELISNYICLNPKYSNVTVKNKSIKILMDSGAFQDRGNDQRLKLEDALQRQLKLENKIGLISEKIVAYDYMGNAEETFKANQFLVNNRKRLMPRQLVLMIQGETTKEYIHCLSKTLKIASAEDCIGFGGVALAGRNNTVKFKLLDAFKMGLPLIWNMGLKDIHVFGVGTFKVLREIKEVCEIYKHIGISKKLNLSCDTSAFEIRSTMGNVINLKEERWEKVYTKPQKFKDYHPAILTQENMRKALQIINKI